MSPAPARPFPVSGRPRLSLPPSLPCALLCSVVRSPLICTLPKITQPLSLVPPLLEPPAGLRTAVRTPQASNLPRRTGTAVTLFRLRLFPRAAARATDHTGQGPRPVQVSAATGTPPHHADATPAAIFKSPAAFACWPLRTRETSRVEERQGGCWLVVAACTIHPWTWTSSGGRRTGAPLRSSWLSTSGARRSRLRTTRKW